MFTKLILKLNKESASASSVQSLKALHGNDCIEDYFLTLPKGVEDLLIADELHQDSRTFRTASDISEKLSELITWTASRRTASLRKFIFASFFAITLAFINQMGKETVQTVYGIVIDNSTAFGLRLFLIPLLIAFCILYVISFLRDAFEYHALFYELRHSAKKLELIVDKWRRDMIKRGVRVDMLSLFTSASPYYKNRPAELIKILNDVETYKVHFKNSSWINRCLDIFDFVWPMGLSIVTILMIYNLTDLS